MSIARIASCQLMRFGLPFAFALRTTNHERSRAKDVAVLLAPRLKRVEVSLEALFETPDRRHLRDLLDTLSR
jgi:hypothetical protein